MGLGRPGGLVLSAAKTSDHWRVPVKVLDPDPAASLPRSHTLPQRENWTGSQSQRVSAVRATRAGRGASLLGGPLSRSRGLWSRGAGPHGGRREAGKPGPGEPWGAGRGPRDEQTRLRWGPGTPGGARAGRDWWLGPGTSPPALGRLLISSETDGGAAGSASTGGCHTEPDGGVVTLSRCAVHGHLLITSDNDFDVE